MLGEHFYQIDFFGLTNTKQKDRHDNVFERRAHNNDLDGKSAYKWYSQLLKWRETLQSSWLRRTEAPTSNQGSLYCPVPKRHAKYW